MKIKSILTILCTTAACLGGLPTANAAASVCRTPNIVCSGQTTAGDTDWVAYGSNGIYVDIDTSECALNSVPAYITSMSGSTNLWSTSGATSVYNPTDTGFRVYVRYTSGKSISPAAANEMNWAINWVALSSADCTQ
ncbi:hypothetical protein [Vibrio quintilis]|uniref:Uncharacterized protein n=1 Tax=Vibrio quintilis TaxID=1117707 RepID=A0A1M7YY18_9VIBR|nr:hypothetical protein [Vibrio quintilis]SHO57462.1 hypothetical protein VQ7734_03232 [Vibrio quintilis]